uniref:Kinesin motor domain-containing protein n=1 Tax=Plectus sambesii TaxID=2011161 RepID=A0A914UNN6_9BILA
MTTNGSAHVNGRTIDNKVSPAVILSSLSLSFSSSSASHFGHSSIFQSKNRFDDQFTDCVNSADINERNFDILRKMYETQVDVKNQLIHNLEDIIDEQETRIFNMESYIQGRTNTLTPRNNLILRGISVLSVDFGTLSEENLSLKEALRKAQKRNRELELQFLSGGYQRPARTCLHSIPVTVDSDAQTDDSLLPGGKNGVHSTTNGHTNGRNGDVEKTKANFAKDITRLKASVDDMRDAQVELIAVAQDTQSAMDHSLLAMRCELQKHVTDFVSNLIVRYRKEAEMRKRLHNQLVELKGNIRVLCRLRPPVRPDEEADQTVQFDELDNSLLSLTTANGRQMQFTCDRAFRPCHSQTDVFEEVGQVITSCVDGYNVCIFAYGHTGSGKTYTMEGSANDPGINRRALAKLFQSTASRGADWRYSISVSMLEIYNEKLRDLLSSSKDQKLNIRIGEHATLHIPGLTEVDVTDHEQVVDVLTMGWRNRAIAATNMNEHSSRSHAIL